MAETGKKDMGTGSVIKWMVSLAVPALVGQLVNLLYNIVDRIYIGHLPGVGADALTGVGLFTPILMLITAFALLSGAGGAPRAAIFMGRGDRPPQRRSCPCSSPPRRARPWPCSWRNPSATSPPRQ